MKLNKSYFSGFLSGLLFMLLLTIIFFCFSPNNNRKIISDVDEEAVGGSNNLKVVTYLDYMDSVANRMNLENHVGVDLADRWETLSDKEKINALLYKYSYEEILTVRKHPNLTYRDILGARESFLERERRKAALKQ